MAALSKNRSARVFEYKEEKIQLKAGISLLEQIDRNLRFIFCC